MKIKESKSELMVDELMKKVFEKAKVESGQKSSHGLSKYLEEQFESTGVTLKLLTFERYYNGYILNGKKIKPNRETRDALSKYLEYVDFIDFCNKNSCYEAKKKLSKKLLWSVMANVILLILSVFYFAKNNEKNCMVWIGDRYERVKCSGADFEKPFDKIEQKNFIKVEPCKDDVFFVNGEPVIHYTRYNNEVNFFTDEGEHPIHYGVFTHPITQTIIDSRVKPCDSRNTN